MKPIRTTVTISDPRAIAWVKETGLKTQAAVTDAILKVIALEAENRRLWALLGLQADVRPVAAPAANEPPAEPEGFAFPDEYTR